MNQSAMHGSSLTYERPWPAAVDPTRVHEVRVVRFVAGEPVETADEVAVEEPFEIRVGGRSVAMIMRTPGRDDFLAAGFLLSEGIIATSGDILSFAPGLDRDGFPQRNLVELRLRPELEQSDRLTRRNFGVTSSCGLCGAATIEAARTYAVPVRSDLIVGAAVLEGLEKTMRTHQAVFARTGGLHAAGLFDCRGNLLAQHEDVGRHNAVDKVIGEMLLAGKMPLADSILLVSGRASFELVQKAVVAGIPVLTAVGAPSSLAIEMAAVNSVTLVGLLRSGRFVVYTRPERIQASS